MFWGYIIRLLDYVIDFDQNTALFMALLPFTAPRTDPS